MIILKSPFWLSSGISNAILLSFSVYLDVPTNEHYTYYFTEGMTWGEFVNSIYNTDLVPNIERGGITYGNPDWTIAYWDTFGGVDYDSLLWNGVEGDDIGAFGFEFGGDEEPVDLNDPIVPGTYQAWFR